MTSPDSPAPVPGRSRVAIELVALLLVLAGVVLVLVAAFAADWRAGLAALGVLVGLGGFYLGNDRTG